MEQRKNNVVASAADNNAAVQLRTTGLSPSGLSPPLRGTGVGGGGGIPVDNDNNKYVKRRPYTQRIKGNMVLNNGLFYVLIGILLLLLGSVLISYDSLPPFAAEVGKSLRRRRDKGTTDLLHNRPPRVAPNTGPHSQQQQQQQHGNGGGDGGNGNDGEGEGEGEHTGAPFGHGEGEGDDEGNGEIRRAYYWARE